MTRARFSAKKPTGGTNSVRPHDRHRLAVRLLPEDIDRLYAIAQERHQSTTSLCRDLIIKSLNEIEASK